MASLAVLIPLVFPFCASSASPPTSQATSRASSQPTSQPVTAALVKQLVQRLGDRSYRVRQAAQKRLTQLGEAALPFMLDTIGGPNPEIANRIASLIARPKDPTLRIEVVVRLLATADPDLMEPAVYMLFESPLEDHARFVKRTRSAKGQQQAIFQVVAEQLETWKKQTMIFNRIYKRLNDQNKPGEARKLLKFHQESMIYQAEAAYWAAVEIAEDYEVNETKSKRATSLPAEK